MAHDSDNRYYIVVKNQTAIEITKEEFIQAERHHGFRPKWDGELATGGFSGGPLVQYSIRKGEWQPYNPTQQQ